jgi:hypothetical protein
LNPKDPKAVNPKTESNTCGLLQAKLEAKNASPTSTCSAAAADEKVRVARQATLNLIQKVQVLHCLDQTLNPKP